jgi:hypothetical protein
MSSNNNKTLAILLVTDKDSPVIELQYEALKKADGNNSDVFIAYHQKETTVPLYMKNTNNFIFTDQVLTGMGFNPLCEGLIPGSNHFPLIQFYRENPSYKYYWVIEDDVRLSGDWKLWFDTFFAITSDFLTCRICHWEEEKNWCWWLLAHPYKRIPLNKRIRSFNPIYRISNIALQFIDMMLLDGWMGHHEVLLPTLLKFGGYRICDFGGDGRYVLPGFTNRFYTSTKPNIMGLIENGTMRFRPIFNAIGSEPNKLYHPVKDFRINKQESIRPIRFHSSIIEMIRSNPHQL